MHKKIKLYADKIGIEFCSTAFDVQSLKFLLSLGIKKELKFPLGKLLIMSYWIIFHISNYLSFCQQVCLL